MKKILFGFLVLVFGLGISLADNNLDAKYEKLLTSTEWICEFEQEGNGVHMYAKTNDIYNKDKTTTSFGETVITIQTPEAADKLSIVYEVKANGKWEILDGKVIASDTKMEFKNISLPEFDNFLNLNDLIPDNVNASSKIVKLTEYEAIFEEEVTKIQEVCKAKK
ncbi:MAG: hypothetical protein LBH45_03370 [Campylobacteraceae bacterium]|jgi:hypothetical protein|nr:hypothetical protein [Campylobacteraceae bacterium]